MGLDAVELILRAEQEFAISIEDSEAEQVRTVGDSYDLVLSKLEPAPDCLTSKAFYSTRRALVEALGVQRRAIRPTTQLETLFPDKGRKLLWNQLGQSDKLAFPRPKYSERWKERLTMINVLFASLITVAGWVAAFRVFGVRDGVTLIMVLSLQWIIMFATAYSMLNRRMVFLGTEIPVNSAGELARVVLGLNDVYFGAQTAEGSRRKTRCGPRW